MMTKYFNDNFDWDLGKYLSEIHMVFSKNSSNLNNFTNFLTELEEKPDSDIEIIEDYGSVEINDELLKSLTRLNENLKNEAFYNFLLIQAYSSFEFSLVEFCKLVNNYKKIGQDFQDHRGAGLDKAKSFLNESFEIDIQKIKGFNKINSEYKSLRNFIVHNNSNIIRNPSKSIEKQKHFISISNNKYLDLTSAGYIFINDIKYIRNLIEISEFIIKEVVDQTKMKIIVTG